MVFLGHRVVPFQLNEKQEPAVVPSEEILSVLES